MDRIINNIVNELTAIGEEVIPVSKENLELIEKAVEIVQDVNKIDTPEYYGAVGKLIAWAGFTKQWVKVVK